MNHCVSCRPGSVRAGRGFGAARAALVAVGGLSLIVAAVAQAQSTCERADAGACVTDVFGPEPPSLVWQELPSPADSTTGTTLTLRFDNPREEAVDVKVRLLGDDGGTRRKSKKLVARDVAPGRSHTWTVDVAALGLAGPDMRFAGQLSAAVRVESPVLCAGGACKAARVGEEAGPDIDAPGATGPLPANARARGEALGAGPIFAVAPEIYFHAGAAPGTLELYGAEVLRTRHGGGDLTGATTAEAGVELVRVSDGGKFAKHKNKYLPEMDALDYDADNASGAPHIPLGPLNLSANQVGLCVKWEIQTVDHGKKITTAGGQEITEDIWNGVPKAPAGGIKVKSAGKTGDGRMAVTARGVVLYARKGDFVDFFETNPKTGCVSFIGDGPGTYEITVLTEHRDARGNRMIHHGADNYLPLAFKKIVELKTAKMATVLVGDATGDATVAAISGFAMYRTTFGVSGKTMYIGNVNTCGKDEDDNPNSDGGAASSAHFNDSGLADGTAFVQVHDGTRPGCSASDHRRFKFIVAHEIGHAWQTLNQGRFEPDDDFNLDDPDETVCRNDDALYTINTLEHSAIGAREGMAHFYATVVWNSPASSEAVFTWFGNPEDPESDDSGAVGGRLFNTCDTPDKCGVTTIKDWLRHWWDWHTPWTPGSKPNPIVTTEAYGNAMNDDGTFRSNYYQKLDEATDAIPALAAYKDEWDHFAELNGVDTWPAGYDCQLVAYPGCDAINPYDSPGQPGCPCADVEPTLNESAYGDDRHYPDGTGSYLVHGMGGTGQYCEDSTTQAGTEAVCNARSSDGAPECMDCGTDTKLACACSNDAECQALGDTTLVCWGGQDQGWPGTATGRCMPAADTPQGKSVLDENPWICLESCTSRGGGDPDRFECMYDQRDPDIAMAHAQCVDVAGCTAPAGWCEQGGMLCDTEQICAIEYDDCCTAECTESADCAAIGFPASYVCDGGGFPGFCVPAGCEFPMADHEFCNMFR